MLGFKSDRKPSKRLDHKKKNCLVYKCTHCKRVIHLKPFCFDKLKGSKGNIPRSHEKLTHQDLRKFEYQR